MIYFESLCNDRDYWHGVIPYILGHLVATATAVVYCGLFIRCQLSLIDDESDPEHVVSWNYAQDAYEYHRRHR